MENELYKKMYDDVLSGEFKPVNFSIYNFIEEDGWVKELNSEYDDVYGIEDFEYVTINLTNEEKSLLLNNDGQVMSKYRGFKSFVELITRPVNLLSIYGLTKTGHKSGFELIVLILDFQIFLPK